MDVQLLQKGLGAGTAPEICGQVTKRASQPGACRLSLPLSPTQPSPCFLLKRRVYLSPRDKFGPGAADAADDDDDDTDGDEGGGEQETEREKNARLKAEAMASKDEVWSTRGRPLGIVVGQTRIFKVDVGAAVKLPVVTFFVLPQKLPWCLFPLATE